MVSQTCRQASSLLSLSLRPRSLNFAPNRSLLPSSWRCIHAEKEEKVPYKPQQTRLPYTNTKRFRNARPQPRAPVSVRVRKHFIVNDDPQVLDAVYKKLFGKDLGLSEDVKWQAVTHKSFDHGRQPFNSKLRFLGKRLLQMHASFHLLSSPPKKPQEPKPSTYTSLEGAQYQNPEPFFHEDYRNIDAVTRTNINAVISEDVLIPIIEESGLASAMRWKPADDFDLARSGESTIAIECLHAVVGAVALQKGGDVAAQFIRQKILNRAP